MAATMGEVMQDGAGQLGQVDHQGQKGGNLVFRFLIPKELCGSIIGKSGSTIARIRQELPSAHLSIGASDQQMQERMLQIAGPPEAVQQCIQVVMQQILQSMQEGGPPIEDQDGEKKDGRPPRGNAEISCRAVIPNSQMGAVIGKGGANVSAMREKSGCLIRISSANQAGPVLNPSRGNERDITCSGTVQQIVTAFLMMISWIAESPNCGAQAPLRPDELTAAQANANGGVMQQQPMRSPWMGMQQQGPRGAADGTMGHAGMVAQNGFRGPQAGVVQQQMMSPATAWGYQQHAQPEAAVQQEQAEPSSVTLELPEKNIGQVIGRGGETINEIRNWCKCKIDVEKSEGKTDGMRKITITGAPACVQSAMFLVHSRAQGIPLPQAVARLQGAASGGFPCYGE